jgi:hypothetical protein
LKKVAIIMGLIGLILLGILYYSKAYYPPLPFDSVSKREVLDAVEDANGALAKVTEDDGYEWYIAKMEQGQAYDHLKAMMKAQGWEFVEQMGSAFLFKQGDADLIVESEMWTGYYVLFQIPSRTA